MLESQVVKRKDLASTIRVFIVQHVTPVKVHFSLSARTLATLSFLLESFSP